MKQWSEPTLAFLRRGSLALAMAGLLLCTVRSSDAEQAAASITAHDLESRI